MQPKAGLSRQFGLTLVATRLSAPKAVLSSSRAHDVMIKDKLADLAQTTCLTGQLLHKKLFATAMQERLSTLSATALNFTHSSNTQNRLSTEATTVITNRADQLFSYHSPAHTAATLLERTSN